jgi:hypothetical protein
MSSFDSTQCQDSPACPGGNCVGCQNGQIWCQDPRCIGYCTNCVPDLTRERLGFVVFIIVIMALLLIIFIVWITYGHQVAYYYVPNYVLEAKGYAVPGCQIEPVLY